MNNKSSIFKSGDATNENTAFGVHEIETDNLTVSNSEIITLDFTV